MMNIQDLFIYLSIFFYLDKLFVNIIFSKEKKSVKLRN